MRKREGIWREGEECKEDSFLRKMEVKQNALWSRVRVESEGLLFKKNMHGRVNAALKTIRV